VGFNVGFNMSFSVDSKVLKGLRTHQWRSY